MVTSIDFTLHPELHEAVHRIVAELKPARIYLFGSQARAEADDDSDYDLLVLVHDDDDGLNSMINRAYDVLWGIRIPIDVIVQRTTRFEERAALKSSLSGTVLREGILLYESR